MSGGSGVADLIFPKHARDEMQRDSVSEDEVYHVVADYDDMLTRLGGRTEYTRLLDDGRRILVVIEGDERTVVTVIWNKRQSRRRRQWS